MLRHLVLPIPHASPYPPSSVAPIHSYPFGACAALPVAQPKLSYPIIPGPSPSSFFSLFFFFSLRAVLLRPARPSPSPRGLPRLCYALRPPCDSLACSPLLSLRFASVRPFEGIPGYRYWQPESRVLHDHSSLTPCEEFVGLRLPAVKSHQSLACCQPPSALF